MAGRVAGRTLQIAFNSLTVVVMPAQAVFFAWKLSQPAAAAPGDTTATVALAPLPPPPSALEATQHAIFGAMCGFGSGFLGVAGLPFVVRSLLTYRELITEMEFVVLLKWPRIFSVFAIQNLAIPPVQQTQSFDTLLGCSLTHAFGAQVTWFSAASDLTHQQCVGTTFMAVTPAVLV
jgi:hypothetical protein